MRRRRPPAYIPIPTGLALTPDPADGATNQAFLYDGLNLALILTPADAPLQRFFMGAPRATAILHATTVPRNWNMNQ